MWGKRIRTGGYAPADADARAGAAYICSSRAWAVPVDENFVRRRVLDVVNAIGELRRLASREPAEMAVDEVYSMRYNLIVLAEALTALSTHILVEGFGYRPRTYVKAVEQLARRLGVTCVDKLKALIRLRDSLLHAYWVIDNEKVHRSIRGNFECVEELLEKVRRHD